MKAEIERKFRVCSDAWRPRVREAIHIRQGYIARGADLVVRVRLTDSDARLTVKTGSAGLRRGEFEFALERSDAEILLAHHVLGHVIDKVRHLVPDAHTGLLWEVDEFEGDNQGLIVAEVELTSEDEEVHSPEWIGEEVTGEPRFYNSALAEHPFSAWTESARLGHLP